MNRFSMNTFLGRVVAVVSLFSVSTLYAASGNSSDVLKYIPADTPYAFASTEAMPDKLADKLEPKMDEILKAYQRVLRHVMAEQLVKMSSEEGGAEDAEQFRAATEELLNLMSLEGVRGAGIDSDSAFALYGNGLLPVMRIELTDPDLFDAALERVEEKAGEALPIGETDGEAYKYISAGALNLIIATVDEQLVVTAVPASYDESQVALAIGVKQPRRSLKKSKSLRSIQKEYGYSAYFTGFVDHKRIAETFTGGASDMDRQLFAAIEFQPPELTDTCTAEVMQMADVAPRMVFGYTTVSADVIESSMIVEVREDIAAGLASIPAVVPGLGTDPGGFMSIGFGLDPLALRKFYEVQLDAMEADPYECELFADLQAGVASGREALNQPIPPVVYSFRGFVANIVNIDGVDFDKGTLPESLDASLLVAVENAESLIAMVAMMDPQIAALNLLPDGKPVKLELAQLAGIADEAFAALSNNALAVSLGEGAESNSADMLVADGVEPAPFMSMNMDAARYYAMIGESMASESMETDGGEPMPKAVSKALSDLMVVSGSMYERMSVDVRFTGRGVEIDGRMLLSE